MNNLDDLFRQDAASRSSTNPSEQPFDKEAWAQKKQELRQWTYETIDAATSSIAQSGDEFQRYLDVQSRFDRYSVSNALLILAQRPEATRIADFDTWKEQGVFIRRKETGFYILEPGEEYRREDGSTGISYNPKKMFDIAQTTASQKREQPTYPDDRMRIKALVDRAPVPIVINDALPPEMHALYQPDTRNIVIRAAWMPGIFSGRSRRSWRMRNWIAAMADTAVPILRSMHIAPLTCCANSSAWTRLPFSSIVCRRS